VINVVPRRPSLYLITIILITLRPIFSHPARHRNRSWVISIQRWSEFINPVSFADLKLTLRGAREQLYWDYTPLFPATIFSYVIIFAFVVLVVIAIITATLVLTAP
jgi:hypothetical protein